MYQFGGELNFFNRLRKVLMILVQTCKGLGHLHEQHIIHRDIKSDNVLLDSQGRVKISKTYSLSTPTVTER